MASKYSNFSPYAKVRQTWYLDYNLPQPLFPADSDRIYTIEPKYNLRPDKLSKELFGNERLYYIFSDLNPDELEDPIYDFTAGTTIRIPTKDRVQKWLDGTRFTK